MSNQKNSIQYFHFTDKGPRIEKEDFYKVEFKNEFFIASIADGVGGRKCGSIASRFCVNNFHEMVKSPNDDLMKTVNEIHENLILEQIKIKECSGMASTFTACVITGITLKCIHSGDTRLCILRGNGIKQLTREHSEAGRLLRTGQISIEIYNSYPRKNIIESALGTSKKIDIQYREFLLQSKDRIILTTDGFHEVLSKIELRDLSKRHLKLESYYQALKSLIKDRKLKDNTSFIIAELP